MPHVRHGDLASWRDGGGDEWPALWPGRDRWPRLALHVWTPTRAVIATACLGEPLQVLRWRNLAEARQATRDLYSKRCRPACAKTHVLLWTDETTVHVARIGPPPPTPSLADELAQCYPRCNSNVERWPRPTVFNEQPPTGVRAMDDEDIEELRRRQDAAFLHNGKQMQPHPGGLPGRVQDAHDDHDEDLARWLTDALIAEREGG